MSDSQEYLIWSHKHGAWWGHHRTGYVRRLSEAGRYSRADALLICRNSVPNALELGALATLPVRLADVLDMLRGPLGEEYEAGGEAWE